MCGPSRTLNRWGIRTSDWFIVGGGDGFQTRNDPDDPNIVYAQSQDGSDHAARPADRRRRRSIRPRASAAPVRGGGGDDAMGGARRQAAGRRGGGARRGRAGAGGRAAGRRRAGGAGAAGDRANWDAPYIDQPALVAPALLGEQQRVSQRRSRRHVDARSARICRAISIATRSRSWARSGRPTRSRDHGSTTRAQQHRRRSTNRRCSKG